jgi:hypothetical protein
MTSFAAPLQIAAATSAIVWPLAAGVSLVLWTKARAAERRRRLAMIEGGLKGMFRTVQGQPVPDRLELVVDALEEHEAMTKFAEASARARRKAAPIS